MLGLNTKQRIIASQIAGDFTLPKDLNKPIAFIAGGVGVAPFRSMIKYVLDKNLSSNIVMFYSNRNKEEILFSDTLEEAFQKGIKTVYTLTDVKNIPKGWRGKTGYINEQMLNEEMPDYKQRTYYVSGPQLMVQNFEKTLRSIGVPKKQIITDFFPGYAENK